MENLITTKTTTTTLIALGDPFPDPKIYTLESLAKLLYDVRNLALYIQGVLSYSLGNGRPTDRPTDGGDAEIRDWSPTARHGWLDGVPSAITAAHTPGAAPRNACACPDTGPTGHETTAQGVVSTDHREGRPLMAAQPVADPFHVSRYFARSHRAA